MNPGDDLARVKAFLRDWDPIRVRPGKPDGAPANEYDSYASNVLQMLADGRDASAVAHHLERLRTHSMGLGPAAASDLTAATKIVEWWKAKPSNVNCYTFTTEPEGVAYAELVEFCCSIASKMILVVRDPGKDAGARINEKLARLSGFRTEVVRANAWPGTTLLGDEALVYSHRVAPGLQPLLQELAAHLFEWVHPAAPEDPCFFRADGRVLLTTTSHETDAYLMLTEREHRALRARAPHVLAILRLER